MTDKEREFEESCDTFRDYKNIDEYISDIRKLLMIGVINQRYSEQAANALIRGDMDFIKKCFFEEKDACYTTVNIAYCCG